MEFISINTFFILLLNASIKLKIDSNRYKRPLALISQNCSVYIHLYVLCFSFLYAMKNSIILRTEQKKKFAFKPFMVE